MDLASAIAEGIAEVDKDVILLGLAGSKMIEAGRAAGLRVASEVFADRAYQADGSLVPRKLPGAVIHDKDEAIRRTVRMIGTMALVALTTRRPPPRMHQPTRIARIAPMIHGETLAS